MSSQSQNNFNIQNKLIRIDGEYVKLYVTTNKTLPKLLKNTGSLIVYHDGVLSEKNDFTPINHLYLGNNLIASGWGFHKEVQRDDAEYFFNYGNGSSDGKHIGGEEFSYNYYDTVRKLYDTIPFWDNDLLSNDVITNYELYFEDERRQHINYPNTYSLPTFKSLYKDANVFSTINDIITRVCYKNNVENAKFIQYDSLLTNPDGTNAPYIYQDFDANSIVESNIGKSYLTNFTANIIKDDTKNLYRRPIYLDMLPYMLGPAIYDKPEIKDIDVKIYYKYSKNSNGGGVASDKFGNFVAKKVNGKYQLPKGANIYAVTLEMDVKMNDGKEITGCGFDYMVTKYNEAKLQITENQSDTTTKVSDILSTLLFDENINLNGVQISNNYKTFTSNYESTNLTIEKQYESKYGTDYTHVTFTYNLGNKLSIPIENTTFIKNLYLKVAGVNKLKKYAAFDTANNGYFYDATKLNCYNSNLNSHIMYSLEYAWKSTLVYLPYDIEIEPVDVIFVGTKPIDPVTGNSDSERYKFNIIELFGNSLNIGTIYNNYSKKLLNAPLRSNNLDGSDILMIGVPNGKLIKNVFANVEYTNNTRRIRKDNITGLLKLISNVNYFISLNPEMNTYDNDKTVYRYAAITDLETNVYSQPYNVYFAILPRTYNKNTDNAIISFEVEFDSEPAYNNRDNVFSAQDWSTLYNFNKRGSANNNIKVVTNNYPYDNIDIPELLLSDNVNVKFVTNVDYDGTHIFNLSMNLTNIQAINLERISSFNPLAQFITETNQNKFIEKYCSELNDLSL